LAGTRSDRLAATDVGLVRKACAGFGEAPDPTIDAGLVGDAKTAMQGAFESYNIFWLEETLSRDELPAPRENGGAADG
jgi:hypothetical protein